MNRAIRAAKLLNAARAACVEDKEEDAYLALNEVVCAAEHLSIYGEPSSSESDLDAFCRLMRIAVMAWEARKTITETDLADAMADIEADYKQVVEIETSIGCEPPSEDDFLDGRSE